MRNNQAKFDNVNDYAKVIAIAQFSGVGKSRMIDEVLKKTPGLAFVMRNRSDSGHTVNEAKMKQASVAALIASTIIEGILHSTTCTHVIYSEFF